MLITSLILITNINNVDGQFFTKTSKSIPRMGRKADNSLIMEPLDSSESINDHDRIPSWNEQQQQQQQSSPLKHQHRTNLLYRLFVQLARLFRQSPQAY
ncbi:hypothetical protein BLA29_005356 [Euroglyphus maynei]|uniref:Uncharacterized protein n=1 Tax=Euroglyphus maynei TaxID=6958 RepID=A0A1Y3BC32_EURMA|nr:hypothetical protein BLA29_005356 [Euroglyphus maynei]